MSKAMKNPCKVITGPKTVFSYLNVNEPKTPLGGGTAKYSVSLIIPKSDTVTVAKIRAAIEAAYKEGEGKLKGTGGKFLTALEDIKTPLRDGDKDRKGDEAYANAWFLNANSTTKPVSSTQTVSRLSKPASCIPVLSAAHRLPSMLTIPTETRGIACGPIKNLQKPSDGHTARRSLQS